MPDVSPQITGSTLTKIVVVALLFQFGVNRFRPFITPVGQQNNEVPIICNRVRAARLDYDGAVQSRLFLKSRMAVIPEGAALPHIKLIGERFTGSYAIKADTWDTIHVGGQNHSVPVDGRVVSQIIGHAQRNSIAFPPTQDRAGYRAVDCGCRSIPAGVIDRLVSNIDVKIRAAQRRNQLSGRSGRK